MIAPGSDGPAQPGASSGACQPASLSGASHSASLEGQASLSGDSGPASLSGASQPASLEGQGSFSGDCEPAPFGGAFQPASIPELEDLVFDDTTSHTPHGVERRTRFQPEPLWQYHLGDWTWRDFDRLASIRTEDAFQTWPITKAATGCPVLTSTLCSSTCTTRADHARIRWSVHLCMERAWCDVCTRTQRGDMSSSCLAQCLSACGHHLPRGASQPAILPRCFSACGRLSVPRTQSLFPRAYTTRWQNVLCRVPAR